MMPGTRRARRACSIFRRCLPCRIVALAGSAWLAASEPGHATGCAFEVQGEGRVAGIIDARTLRLDDGREIRLAGIEPADAASGAAALAALLAGRDVLLRATDDTPDRYGQQTAFVFPVGSETPVQADLLRQGAMLAARVADRDCAETLRAAEAEARNGKKGVWATGSAIKNAESAGDILAGIGRFMVVEGRVLSVRQAGARTYLNFGRNWTRDFAATISRRDAVVSVTAGLSPKSFENRRIRVRGYVEARGGPRMELHSTGQVELLGGN